jgi:hypothetical protein
MVGSTHRNAATLHLLPIAYCLLPVFPPQLRQFGIFAELVDTVGHGQCQPLWAIEYPESQDVIQKKGCARSEKGGWYGGSFTGGKGLLGSERGVLIYL